MDARYGTQAVGRKKLRLIKHVAKRALQPLARWDRHDAVLMMRALLAEGDEFRQIGPVLDEPLHPLRKAGQLLNLLFLQHLDGDQRQEADERTCAQRSGLTVQPELVVVETVAFIPEPGAAEVVDRIRDVDVVFEELRCHVFIHGIFLSQLQRHG